ENTFIILVSTTAFLITFTSCLTFKLIETPFIKLTKQTTTLVKELIPTLTNNNQ
ncbi:acyltransferase, partial [Shigella flexneri]